MNTSPAAPSKLLTRSHEHEFQQQSASIHEPSPINTRHSVEGVSSRMVILSPLVRKKRLSSASMPQLRETAVITTPIEVTSVTPPQMVTRSDMDMHSRFKTRGRRRRHDGQQLSPRPHLNGHQRGSNAPPSPSSPATPTSVQSGKSRQSSSRRNAVSSAAASTEFDFLNEMDFVPEDTEELEAMGGRGINAEETTDDDTEEESEENDEFSDNDNYEDEEYKEDDY